MNALAILVWLPVLCTHTSCFVFPVVLWLGNVASSQALLHDLCQIPMFRAVVGERNKLNILQRKLYSYALVNCANERVPLDATNENWRSKHATIRIHVAVEARPAPLSGAILKSKALGIDV